MIKVDNSVTHENLVEIIEMGGITKIEAQLPKSDCVAKIYELNGQIFCETTPSIGVMQWSNGDWWIERR